MANRERELLAVFSGRTPSWGSENRGRVSIKASREWMTHFYLLRARSNLLYNRGNLREKSETVHFSSCLDEHPFLGTRPTASCRDVRLQIWAWQRMLLRCFHSRGSRPTAVEDCRELGSQRVFVRAETFLPQCQAGFGHPQRQVLCFSSKLIPPSVNVASWR